MSQQQVAHEQLGGDDDAKAGSERSFGFVFAAVCALVAGFQLWRGHTSFWAWVGAAAVFAAVALAAPMLLRPFNILWFKFGMLLHHIVSPIILVLMFFAVFTPTGWWMRMIGKRPLHLRFERDAKSYWVMRTPPGPPPESFPKQG
jgi:predicted membrane metal-binding protein